MFKIDSHVHIYPDKIAAKAAKGIGRFYDITIHHDGSITQMIAEEDRAGISRMIAHSVATTPTQVAHINEFIMSARDEYPDRIIPFAALHPDTPDMELVQLVSFGCGVDAITTDEARAILERAGK